MNLDEVKREVAIANRILAEVGLATGVLASLGHSSMRVPDDPETFVVKGRGYAIDALSAMRPEEMIVCDLEGFKVGGPPNTMQCFEVKMHSAIYKTHPEVQSVTHVHPRYVVVMSVLEAELRPMCQEGAEMLLEPLPVYHHTRTVQTDDEGMEVAALLGNHPAVLLEGHGATTVGRTLEESVMNMLQLEEQARMNWYGYSAAGPSYRSIPPEYIREMSERQAAAELPHFKDVIGQVDRRVGGVWQYYTDRVSREM